MNVLIAYATIEGHTRKVSEFLAERLREQGHQADLVDLDSTDGNADIANYERIIIGASVHEKRHQPSVGGFIIANREALSQKPTLFLSVSLAAAFEDRQTEAESYAYDFLSYLEWTPGQTLMVAGALKYDEYDFFKSQILEHVVLKEDRVDGDKADHVFTDWAAVGAAVDEFIGA